MLGPMADILLEAGTNEVELIEFLIDGRPFSVNVLKLQEVVQFDASQVTPMPGQHANLLGSFLLRGSALPLIDLDQHLHGPRSRPIAERARVVLVTRLNGVRCAFAVQGVHRIHRVSWKAMTPLSPCLVSSRSFLTASVHIDNRDMMVVDLEAVIAEIMPQTRLDNELPPERQAPPPAQAGRTRRERGDLRVLMAEDSRLIRHEIVHVFQQAGYTQLTACADGQEAYDNLVAAKQAGGPMPDLILSDIEMPRLDGLTLCRRVRQELGLTEVPVILFSSLIDEQMIGRCRSVGATNWVTKPRIADVIGMADEALDHAG